MQRRSSRADLGVSMVARVWRVVSLLLCTLPAGSFVSAAGWDAVLEGEVAQARELYRAEKHPLAYHFCRNALALNYLVSDAATREANVERLTRMRDACVASQGSITRPCPLCEGSGQGVFRAKSELTRSSIGARAAGICNRCGGGGALPSVETVDAVKYRRAQTARAYREMQLSRTFVPVGDAWVPQAREGALSVQERVLLKCAIPLVCDSCQGVGREDCRTCKGLGIVTCRARGCERGRVEEERDSLTDERRVVERFCDQCGGTAEETCERCIGKGSLVCRDCNGSGEAEVCKRCSGRGLATCRKCQGSGTYRDGACGYCQGVGVMECTSCNGCGRR